MLGTKVALCCVRNFISIVIIESIHVLVMGGTSTCVVVILGLCIDFLEVEDFGYVTMKVLMTQVTFTGICMLQKVR